MSKEGDQKKRGKDGVLDCTGAQVTWDARKVSSDHDTKAEREEKREGNWGGGIF